MLPLGALRESVLEEVRGRFPVIDEAKKESNNTIRFDLCLAGSFPFDAPRELWLDHAIVHETSESYQDHVLTYLDDFEDPTKSYPFRRMEDTKKRRFKALIPMAHHLLKQRILDFQPFFLFPIVSALGYLNDDATKMMKWMSTVFNKTVTSFRDDGIRLGVIKARFKTEVRNAICFGIIRGNALAMNSVGRPMVSRPL
jgi:hypothetical protein